MNVCDICGYSLEIVKLTTQNINNMTTYTEPNDFIKLFTIKKKKQTEIKEINLLNMHIELLFDKKTLVDKLKSIDINSDIEQYILDKFNEYQNNIKPNKFCWECINCAQTYILNSGIITYINFISTTNKQIIENIDDIIDDYTYPRTNDFICPNKNCSKSKKQAVIYRPDPHKYDTVYICVSCKTQF